jgi:hypothetical protein
VDNGQHNSASQACGDRHGVVAESVTRRRDTCRYGYRWGLALLPGADDVLAVQVRWLASVGTTAALAIDRDWVYAASDAMTAFALADGSMAWEAEHPKGYALEDSGEVVIGLDGPGVVRVFAPWEYDLRVERATGRRIGFRESPGGDVPADLVAFPAPLPTQFHIETEADLRETVAFWPDGQVAWRLVVAHPGIGALPRSMPTEPSCVPPPPGT